MSNPYFDTHLEDDIRAEPHQMNNNILENIKENLYRKHKGRCYKDYGYVSAIYGLDGDILGGLIRAEDSTSSSLHRVRFRCKLCNPIKFTKIVAKITGIHRMLIIAEAGPIRFVIGHQSINQNNVVYVTAKSSFFPKNDKNEIIDRPIIAGTYIIVKLIRKEIINGVERIMAIGTLESIASDEDIKRSIKYEYDQQENINIEDFMKRDEQAVDRVEDFVEETESTDSDGDEGEGDD